MRLLFVHAEIPRDRLQAILSQGLDGRNWPRL
jgi:hypothetical protein